MSRNTFLFSLLLLMIGIVPRLAAQVATGNAIFGNNSFQSSNSSTVISDGQMVFGGQTFTSPNVGDKVGFLLWENATNFGTPNFAMTYTQNNGDFNIQAIEAATTPRTLAVVANRSGGTGTTDGAFMHIGTNGAVLHARVWNSSNYEFIENVKVLADGSFLVMGSIESAFDGTRQAFASLLAPPNQNYQVLWHRTLGVSTGAPGSFDRAFAAAQHTDGRIFVAGFTDQAAVHQQGAIFLWELSLGGATLALRRYSVDPSVLRPFPEDLIVESTGEISMIGNSVHSSMNGNFIGWHMSIASDRVTTSFGSCVQPSHLDKNLQFRSMVTTGTFYQVVGTVDREVTGTVNKEALLATFSLFAGISNARTYGFTGDDFFTDVNVVGTNELRATGGTNRPIVFTQNMANSNVLEVRREFPNLTTCLGQSISLQFIPKSVIANVISMGTGTTMTTAQSTIVTRRVSMNGLTTCVAAKTAEAEESQPINAIATPQVFPNPATGTATLRLPAHTGEAEVTMIDATGKLVRQLRMSSEEANLDLHGLGSGLYFIRVKGLAEPVTLKLMVQ